MAMPRHKKLPSIQYHYIKLNNMVADCALHQASVYQCQPLTHPLEFTNVSHDNKLQQFRASSVRNPSFSRFNFSEKSSFFFLPAMWPSLTEHGDGAILVDRPSAVTGPPAAHSSASSPSRTHPPRGTGGVTTSTCRVSRQCSVPRW